MIERQYPFGEVNLGLMDDLQDVFRTSETPLAAFLVSQGFTLLRIEYEGKRGFYVFPDNDFCLIEAQKNFAMHKAVGNICAYEAARQELTEKVKFRRTT